MPDEPDDQRNFSGLYHQTLVRLRRYLARMLGNQTDAQDVAHDVYLRIYPKVQDQSENNPQAVLYTTARRLAINRLNRRGIAPFIPGSINSGRGATSHGTPGTATVGRSHRATARRMLVCAVVTENRTTLALRNRAAAGHMPRSMHKIETDLAVRYVAADTAAETNVSPTFALKADLAGGFSARGSFTTSNRFPTSEMSRKLNASCGTGGTGSDTLASIKDPLRPDESPYSGGGRSGRQPDQTLLAD